MIYEYDRPYGGVLDEKSVTADEFPATEAEELETGLLDQWGRKILRRPARIKLGFDLG